MALLSMLLLAACSKAAHHPGWVIHSKIELAGPPPPGGYRLIFPYIIGDLYGSPNTGDFVAPVSRAPGSFVLDLNHTQEALERELAPTDFSLRFLHLTPADARIARLTPIALQRDGIDAVGAVQWLDAQSRRPLMLVFVDRPAQIEGSLTRAGATIRYDIRAPKPGYLWIGSVRVGEHETLYTAVPPPRRLVLTISATGPRGRDESKRER
ncbi:MAG: hypothetical protein WBW93_02310 [Steroidobacteraceae bacterium]